MSTPLGVAWGVVGGVGTLGAAVAVLAVGVRWARARWARVADFLEDWNGERGRPGVPRRPGVMERLDALEATTRTIRAEVTPNGGGSLKDVIGRIDERTSRDGQLLGEHMTWHRNAGAVDPTARVLLARPEMTTESRST
jgi:hypothetical protein